LILLKKMWYGDFIETSKSGDEWIDGMINEDILWLDVIYIQAKRRQWQVSRPELQKFVGALAGKKAKKGVFVTTSQFSNDARNYAGQMDIKVILIDGDKLVDLMHSYGVWVQVRNTYEVKEIDEDFFENN
jgi:restriction system protein